MLMLLRRVEVENNHQLRVEVVIAFDWLSKISTVVKLRLQAHENVFVDHLSFVKGKDGWKIVAKVWHLESTAEIITNDVATG